MLSLQCSIALLTYMCSLASWFVNMSRAAPDVTLDQFHGRIWEMVACGFHCDNMPMQLTAIFHCCENANFQMKNSVFSYFHSKHRLWVHVRTVSVRQFL